MYGLISEDYLMHHGVKGQKWGVRKQYQLKGRVRRAYPTSLNTSRNASSNKTRRRAKKNLKKGAIVAGVILGAAAGTVLVKRGLNTRKIKAGLNYINAHPAFDDLTKTHYSSLNRKQQLSFIKNRLNTDTQKRLVRDWYK